MNKPLFKRTTLQRNFLTKYKKYQDKILLCSRPTNKSWWGDRTFFLSKDYDTRKHYNHRSTLDCEVVIEFDEPDIVDNRSYANKVEKRLIEDKIDYAKWYSGGKSTHIHILFDIGKVRNLQLLKKTIMRYYARGLKALPDFRLASDNHMIRAEYGLHERTRTHKKLLRKTKGYGRKLSPIKEVIWAEYEKAYNTVLKRRTTSEVNDMVSHPGVKYILTSEKFREADDGRERALFMLIHVLKPKYVGRKDELVKFLQDWYHYSGGRQLSNHQIACKVGYHWEKTYTFGDNYVRELLESIGVDLDEVIKNESKRKTN